MIVVLVVVLLYALSLVAYQWLRASQHPLTPPDLKATSGTVVLITLTSLNTIDDQINARVLVLPAADLVDPRLGVLTTDMTVRLRPATDLQLRYAAGDAPGEVTTSIPASGIADHWPFDTFTSESVNADVLIGSGASRQMRPARVEIAGLIDGWHIATTHAGPSKLGAEGGDNASVQLTRSRGQLAFDVGICLVLLTLPAVALFVAIETVRRRRRFQPPFSTFLAAMLFAVIPIRNVFPGNPPPGGWVDQALVLWVLMALVAAIVLYIIAWHRQSD